MLRICLSSVSVDLRAYKKNFCCITLTLQLKWPPRWNQSKLPQIVQDGHLKRQLAELVPNLLYQNSFFFFFVVGETSSFRHRKHPPPPPPPPPPFFPTKNPNPPPPPPRGAAGPRP